MLAISNVVKGLERLDVAADLLAEGRRVADEAEYLRVTEVNELGGQWEPPQPGHRYTAFQAGVQLANRGGALVGRLPNAVAE